MIYGFMNVPNADGPHPVIIALHGYIDPAIYQTLDYTTRYADALATGRLRGAASQPARLSALRQRR